MACEIVKQDTCVLRPQEAVRMFDLMTPTYRAICEALLHTQMRFEELKWFIQHPEAYKPSRRCIGLPKDAIKKTETVFKERDVILSIRGCEVVEHLIAMKLKPKEVVSRQALNVYLDKIAITAGVGSEHICPKMYRKTMISWLVAIYPEKHAWINSSAGHTSDIQLRHYIGTSFARGDLDDMRSLLKGWGEA
jgi:hypothetical protein